MNKCTDGCRVIPLFDTSSYLANLLTPLAVDAVTLAAASCSPADVTAFPHFPLWQLSGGFFSLMTKPLSVDLPDRFVPLVTSLLFGRVAFCCSIHAPICVCGSRDVHVPSPAARWVWEMHAVCH